MASGQIRLRRIGRGSNRTEVLGAAIARLPQDRGLGLDALEQLGKRIGEGIAPLDLQLLGQRGDVDAGLLDTRDHGLGVGRVGRQQRADAAVAAERQQGRLRHGVDGVFGGKRRDVVGVRQGRILGAGARPQQPLRLRPGSREALPALRTRADPDTP